MAKLSGWAEEVFYRRLMSVVDDFGRYFADPGLLRAACYPRHLSKVSDSDIGKWLSGCETAALVRVYAIDGERYLQLLDFRQQVRAKVSRFPDPPSECLASATQAQSSAHLDVDVSVDVDEGDSSSGKPDIAPQKRVNGNRALVEIAADVLDYLNRAAGKGFELRNPAGGLTANAEAILARLKEGYTREQLREVVFFKCEQWKGNEEMAEYLRPETLFGRKKFQQYIGELKHG